MSKNKITLVLGQKGTGKSTKADQMREHIERIIIFDPLDDFSGGVIIRTPQTFFKLIETVSQTENFSFVLKFWNDAYYEEVLEYLSPSDAPPALTNYVLFIDEIHLFATTHYISHALKRIVTTGRHSNIDMIFVSQRPLNIHPTIRSQTDVVISGRQTNEADLKQIERDFNFPVEKLRTLKDWEFIEHVVL